MGQLWSCLSLISPSPFLESFSFFFLFFSFFWGGRGWRVRQLDPCVLLCAPLPQAHVACFLLSVPASQTWNGEDEAGTTTLPANPPWATQPWPKLYRWLFLLSQACSLAALPLYPTHTPTCNKPFRCAVWMPFPRPNYYVFSCCGWSTGSNPPSSPIFQFLKKQLLKSSSKLPYTVIFFTLNSSCTKLLCGKGFSWFLTKKNYLFLFLIDWQWAVDWALGLNAALMFPPSSSIFHMFIQV